MQRVLVHLIKRAVHEAPDRGLFAERYEGAEIPIVPRYWLLICQTALDLLENVRALLVRGLRARWNILTFLADPRGRRAIAEREDVLVASRLQRRKNHELIDTIRFKTVQSSEHVWCPHTGSPHH